ncbi:tetratricopeptide repeat protein [Nocardia sp. NPDC051787]|uniref:tetratricopeptide repeat protein n=1 Tax=Nocardia sp. NPDC051787 TaxID=3155415 RepID=UPI0034459EF1
MADRYALIVGSQCAALPRLGFVEELALELHAALTRGGGWKSVGGGGPLLNPTVAELKAEIKKAFAVANASSATLLIFFLGHGSSVGAQDFRLLAADSPGLSADSDTAVHLTQTIRERLGECQSLDGLVVLVDACEAGAGVAGAAARWPDMLTIDGRFELLAASGDHNAYDGCFTRTLLDMFAAGIPTAGSQLLCIDLVDDLAGACPNQIPHHTSHTRGSPVRTGVGDRGLWLVPNPALNRNAVTGQAAAGFVDQLTTSVLITETVRDALQAILDARAAPLRLVLGAPGAGKSTLLSLLIRPNLVDDLDINEKYVTAAVFLDTTSTLDSLAADLAAQLDTRLPGYTATRDAVRKALTDQERATLTGFDIDITRTLRRCGKRVTLVIDGLDQPELGARRIILAAIRRLTTADAARPPVHVIGGVRTGTDAEHTAELGHGIRIHLPAPTACDLRRALSAAAVDDTVGLDRLLDASVAGGWLIARLLTEIDFATLASEPRRPTSLATLIKVKLGSIGRRATDPSAAYATVRVLLAAGVGPIMPISVLSATLTLIGHDLPLPRLRDILVDLSILISRGRPGQPDETVGIIHTEFATLLRGLLDTAEADGAAIHRAIITALDTLAEGNAAGSRAIAAYASSSLPRHYLAAGDPVGALAALEQSNLDRAADNQQRWASWLPEFERVLGAEHPHTLHVRSGLARWLGESGHVVSAVTEFEKLLICRKRILGPDHPNTLTTRSDLALWRGRSGDVVAAVEELEALLVDRSRISGRDHPHTFTTISDLAYWRGQSGDVTGAIADLDRLLDNRLRVLDPRHPDILTIRGLLASLRGRGGDIAEAISDFKALLADRRQILGPEHPDTLSTRGDLAFWLARNGDVDDAVAQYRTLLVERQKALGSDHPDTLRTRGSVAFWQGASGSPMAAVAEYRKQVEERRRLLGPDHANTLRAQENLAGWLGASGDMDGAIAEYEELHAIRLRLLGPSHPATIAASRGIVFWRSIQKEHK